MSATQLAAEKAEGEAATVTQWATADEWAGVLPAGGYRYEEELGQGGMGVVWKAVRISTGETFAIKKLRSDSFTPAGIRRFVAEARSLAAVRHESVVQLFDFVPDPADPFLVLEYVPGESLAAHIKSVGPLHPDRAARLMAAAARGVQAAHDAGVVHRDLKPGNLLLTRDGRVKVADFGLCKSLGEAEVPTPEGGASAGDDNTPQGLGALTATGRMAGGTPGFMAPEQVSEEFGPVGRAADVWGLGACLYAALTAQTPFPGGKGNTGRVVSDGLVPPHEVNPSVPADLSAVVVKCLTKDPAGRYESAAAVAADLGRCVAGDGPSVRPRAWPVRAWRRVRASSRGVVAATAVAVLAVAVGVTLAVVPWRAEKATDERAAQRDRFLAGEEVVLVPEKGLPKWSEWVVGQADVSESPGRDGTAYIRPFGLGVLKLFDPPGDEFRASFDLQHLSAQDHLDDSSTYVGVALFHHRDPAPPADLDHYMTLSFADYDKGWWRSRPPAPQPLDFESWYHLHYGPGREPGVTRYPLRPRLHQFDALPKLPGQWRRVAVEVRRTGVQVFWTADADDPKAEPALVGTFTAAELNTHAKVLRNAEDRPLPVGASDRWNPSGGLGVYACRSGLAFRNVTVRSLSE